MSEDEEKPMRLALRVARAETVAEGISMFELRASDEGDLPAFSAGAHINVRTPNGSFRNYSIVNGTQDRNRYVIAVKREAKGRGGSVSLVEGTRVGDAIDVSAPKNLFVLGDTAPGYVFIAGGIGITPILSMIRTVASSSGKPFRLYYLSRSEEGTAFLADVRAFAQPDREIIVHHDQGDAARAFDLWPVLEQPTKDHVYCCGPRPLMDAVRDMTGHWPEHAIHFEDFGSDLARPMADDVPFSVKLARSGASLNVPVGKSILEVLRSHGVETPSSCESGTCGTCRTALLSGTVSHRDLVLDDQERENNIIVCVSRGVGTIEIDR